MSTDQRPTAAREEGVCRHSNPLDDVKPDVTSLRPDVEQLMVCKEEEEEEEEAEEEEAVPPEQPGSSSSPDHEDPLKSVHIKEEPVEEQLGGPEEAEVTKVTLAPVKSEDDEEEAQSSQLTVDCGGPGPHRDSDPDPCRPDSEDSVDSDFWKETRERRAGSDSLRNEEPSEPPDPQSDGSDFWNDRKPEPDPGGSRSPVSDGAASPEPGDGALCCPVCAKTFLQVCNLNNHMRVHTGKRPFTCPFCGQTCPYESQLKIHIRTHTGEKPFECPVCGKKYAHKGSMQSHMVLHTVEKQYTCTVCDESFTWFTELKYHQCVGEAASRQGVT